MCGRRAEQLASALKGGCNRGGQALALDQFHCTDSVADVAGWLKQETDARVAAGAPRKAHVMPLGAMLAAWVTANSLLPLEQAVAQLSVNSCEIL